MTLHSDPVQAASLLRMANQIASNAHHKPHDQAVALVEKHFRDFWAPSMRATLLEWLDDGGEGLDDVARDAIERFRA
jgi:formate dehydrogenase subunit delta